jgi:hypothetical protein
VYWIAVYALMAAAVFSMAGLLILAGFVCSGVEAWIRLYLSKAKHPVTIGIPVAVPSPLANGGADND